MKSYLLNFLIRIIQMSTSPQAVSREPKHVISKQYRGPPVHTFHCTLSYIYARIPSHRMRRYIRAEPPTGGSSSQFCGNPGLELLFLTVVLEGTDGGITRRRRLSWGGWGRRGGKCVMHRSAQRHCVCVWDSSTVFQWVLSPVGQSAAPPKPSCAREPGHIPLREVDGWTCIMIEIGKSLTRPGGGG